MTKIFNNELKCIIEADDLENFEQVFKVSNVQQLVCQIINYSHFAKANPPATPSMDDCDALKYALHCQSDKIFDYLLKLSTVNPYGQSYGFPLLSMALKNERYDYADKIINHWSFDKYRMSHMNALRYPENKKQAEKHFEFVFNYLQKLDFSLFRNGANKEVLLHCMTWSEKTYDKLEQLWQSHHKNSSLMDLFGNDIQNLCVHVFSKHYKDYVAQKIPQSYIQSFLKNCFTQSASQLLHFSHVDSPTDGFKILLKEKKLLFKNLYKEPLFCSYLPKETILLLLDNNFDLFRKNGEKSCAAAFMLFHSEDKHVYLLDMFADKVKDLLIIEKQRNRHYPQIESHLLHNSLTEKLTPSVQKHKIKI